MTSSDQRLEALQVPTSTLIRATMEVIDRGGVEIAFVVDRAGRIVGTVSDGDLRRALLGGAGLDDPVEPHVQRSFVSVGTRDDRAGVLDLMQARGVTQVPVLDGDGRMVALHLLTELLGAAPRGNVAVVLAGGRGMRLRPLTQDLPKPMVRVAGRPILERIVLHLVGAGIPTIYLSVNYLADAIAGHFGNGERFGCQIEYLREDPEVPLGTAGPLALLPHEVISTGAPILVLNGDLVTQFTVGDLFDAHERAGAALTMGVRELLHQIPYGVVRTDAGRINHIEEKPTASWTVNAGVYVVDPSVVASIPTHRDFPMTELIGACLADGRPVAAHHLDGDWIDVGEFDELARARGAGR